MAHDLDALKEDLYEAFNRAMECVRHYSYLSSENRVDATARSVSAASDAANAIVNVEREIAERDGAKHSLKLPGK